MKTWSRFKALFGRKPVNGTAILNEGRRGIIGSQEAILFDRPLSPEECRAIKEAWERAYIGTGQQGTPPAFKSFVESYRRTNNG